MPHNPQESSNSWEERIPLNQLASDMFDRDFEIIPENRQKLVAAISTLLKHERERMITEVYKILEGHEDSNYASIRLSKLSALKKE